MGQTLEGAELEAAVRDAQAAFNEAEVAFKKNEGRLHEGG